MEVLCFVFYLQVNECASGRAGSVSREQFCARNSRPRARYQRRFPRGGHSACEMETLTSRQRRSWLAEHRVEVRVQIARSPSFTPAC